MVHFCHVPFAAHPITPPQRKQPTLRRATVSPDSDTTGTVRIPWFPGPPGDDTTQKPCRMGLGRFSYSLLSIIPYLSSNVGTFVFEWLGEQSNIQHRTIHRTTPPQSARSGCQLPQRWSRGRSAPGLIPFIQVLAKSWVTGGCYPPLRFEWGSRFHSSNHTVDVQTPPVSLTLNHLPFQGRQGRYAPGISFSPGLQQRFCHEP